MRRRTALLALALGALAGCASTDTLERRGAALSLKPPSDVARQLVGRWGADCKVVISGVGLNGRLVGWGLDGEPIAGRFREQRGDAGAAGVLTFKWPVALVGLQPGTALSSANVVGGELVYTFYPAAARLRLTGPHPRWQNASYPVPQSFDLDRCAEGPDAPRRDWSPIGSLAPA